MSRRLMRPVRAAAGALAGLLLLSGCGFDVYSLPLPGGADVGSDPITVKVAFDDVLDLVPKSSVKVNDVAVGQVTKVQLDGYKAVVTLELRKDVDLPDKPVASIRQTSLLGEKFVSLAAPPGGGSGKLSNGDTIPDGGRNPEVEEVLGALSLVLNGGGVAQLKTIANELNLALEGREDSAKSVLTQLSNLTGQLARRKQDIVNAIDSVNRLAVSARNQQTSIDNALDELPSALDSLDRQRDDLVAMLQGLTRLSNVGVRVITTTKEQTINSLKALDPILTQIAKSGDDFVKGFSTFLTYPFVDEAVGRDPAVAAKLNMGDYVNLSVDLQLDLGDATLPDLLCIPINALPDSPLNDIINLPNLCDGVTATIQSCIKTPPDPAACLKLPSFLLDNVCSAVKILCGVTGPLSGVLGGVGGAAPTRGNRGGQGAAAPPNGNALGNLLGSVLGGGGLGRPAPGGTSQVDTMWKAFDDTYDTDMVSLLAGPMLSTGARPGGTR